MGTTSPKNLRYPEPTTEARTLHTRVKELADDMSTVLADHDARLTALDTKTDATNSLLSARGQAATRYGNAAGVFTHSPNDGINRTISQHTDQFYIASNAVYAQVSVSQASYHQSFYPGAGVWEVLVNFAGSGWQAVNGNSLRVHTNDQLLIDLGFHVVGVFDVRSYRGTYGSIATNFQNDAGSNAWVVHGNMFWSVASFS